MGFFSALFGGGASADPVAQAMIEGGITSRAMYVKACGYAAGYANVMVETLKQNGFEVTRENVRQVAFNSVYEPKYLYRSKAEDFAEVVSRFATGDQLSMDSAEMFALVAGYDAAKRSEENKQRSKLAASNKVKVKYRRSHVDVSNFEHVEFDDGELPEAWYDAEHEYMLLRLDDTVYHYTRVPAEVWESLKAEHEYPYDFYSMEIEGNYDARDGGVPSYK